MLCAKAYCCNNGLLVSSGLHHDLHAAGDARSMPASIHEHGIVIMVTWMRKQLLHYIKHLTRFSCGACVLRLHCLPMAEQADA